MSTFDAWELPQYLPPDTARAQDGSRIRTVPNPAVPVPVVFSTPWLDAEIRPWVKPSASVCFPLHPLGAVTLYARARKLLTEMGLDASMTPEQLAHTEVCLWRFASKLYRAGDSIRARLDLAVDNRHFQIREEDDRDPFVAQPAHIAAWLVVRAATTWAKEFGS